MSIKGPIIVKNRGYTMHFTWIEDHWYGHIINIKDLITARAEIDISCPAEAMDAIDDYLNTCKELGVEPNKPT